MPVLKSRTTKNSLICCQVTPTRERVDSIMSHPEFLKQNFEKAGVQRAQPSDGFGMPPKNSFFPFFLAPPEAAREGREVGPSPTPQAKGWLPFAIPLVKGIDVYRTSVRKIRDDSCIFLL